MLKGFLGNFDERMSLGEESALVMLKRLRRFSEMERLSFKDNKVIVKIKQLLMYMVKSYSQVIED